MQIKSSQLLDRDDLLGFTANTKESSDGNCIIVSVDQNEDGKKFDVSIGTVFLASQRTESIGFYQGLTKKAALAILDGYKLYF